MEIKHNNLDFQDNKIDRTSCSNYLQKSLKLNSYINRESKNFFTDSSQKQTKDFTLEDREQLWWWKNAVMGRNVWYYRDRISTVRGPCTLPVLREAWTKGIIDDKTLIWGNGLIDWIPIRNISLLTSAIRTPEVQIATFIKKKMSFENKIDQIRRERN